MSAREARKAGRREPALQALAVAASLELDAAAADGVAREYWDLGEHGRLFEFLGRRGRRGLAAGSWLVSAREARKAGRREPALQALAVAASLELDAASADGVAREYWELGEHGRLSEFLGRWGRRGLAAGPWLVSAREARKAGRREPALQALAVAASLELDAAAADGVAREYWELGEHDQLSVFLARESKRHDLDPLPWEARERDARLAGRGEAARSAAGCARDLRAARFQRLSLSRAAALKEGEPRRAGEILGQMLACWPRDGGLWAELGRLAAEVGAGSVVDEALQRAQGGEEAARDRAAAMRLVSDVERASGWGFVGAGVWSGLAGLAMRGGDGAQARLFLQKAEAEAGEARELRGIALAYQDLPDREAALRVWDRLISRHVPAEPEWLSGRGVLQAMMGRREQALTDLRQSIASDPSFLSAYLTLGSLYVAQGDRASARRLYDQALSRRGAGPEQVLRLIRQEREKL
ncbi:MAG: hypothetical protein HY926_07780 [Elusimicrobia bacterium]|nr:hypothetical protein [Elusimicrobiota bacterium]